MSQYHHQLVFYHTITPLHIGCGQEVGLVDNPIIREKTTGFPFIPGSGIRGVLRDRCEGKPELETLFGHEPDATIDPGEDYAGCISIHDAKILFFPVRTSVNLFHWITCPYAIERFNRDVKYFDLSKSSQVAAFAEDGIVKLQEELGGDNQFYAIGSFNTEKIFLEEYPFKKIPDQITVKKDGEDKELLKKWFDENNFGVDKKQVLIVNNRVFDYFVQHATIVQQHNRLTSAKTVAEGALFSVESVPPETLFYGIIGGTKDRKTNGSTFDNGQKAIDKLLEFVSNPNNSAVITLGGDESTGLGVARMFWQRTNNNGKKEEEDENAKP